MTAFTPAQDTQSYTTKFGTIRLTPNPDGSTDWVAHDTAGRFVALDTAPTRAYAITEGAMALVRAAHTVNEHGLVWAGFRRGWVSPASLGLIP